MNDAAKTLAAEPDPDPWTCQREMERAVRLYVAIPRQTHAFAMLAKESVFRAQDMLHDVPDEGLARRVEKRLAKIRAELEGLDRDIRNAGGA